MRRPVGERTKKPFQEPNTFQANGQTLSVLIIFSFKSYLLNENHSQDVPRHGNTLDDKILDGLGRDGILSAHGTSDIGREKGVTIEEHIKDEPGTSSTHKLPPVGPCQLHGQTQTLVGRDLSSHLPLVVLALGEPECTWY